MGRAGHLLVSGASGHNAKLRILMEPPAKLQPVPDCRRFADDAAHAGAEWTRAVTTASRESGLADWFHAVMAAAASAAAPDLRPVSGDASFRRYFRARHGERSYILMD